MFHGPRHRFSSPESGHQEWNERGGGSLERRHRLLSRRWGDPSQGAPRKFASPSPSSALTAISNRRACSRAGPPGARRGRGRASRSALSSERAGVGVDGSRCRKSPSPVPLGPVPLRALCPGFGDLGGRPRPQPRSLAVASRRPVYPRPSSPSPGLG